MRIVGIVTAAMVAFLLAQETSKQPTPQKEQFKWLKDFDEAKKKAEERKVFVLIYFTGPG